MKILLILVLSFFGMRAQAAIPPQLNLACFDGTGNKNLFKKGGGVNGLVVDVFDISCQTSIENTAFKTAYVKFVATLRKKSGMYIVANYWYSIQDQSQDQNSKMTQLPKFYIPGSMKKNWKETQFLKKDGDAYNQINLYLTVTLYSLNGDKQMTLKEKFLLKDIPGKD